MKIKEGFVLRSVAGEFVVAGEGLGQINFNKIISLNETAAYLWQKVAEVEFTAQTLADLLTSEYEIDAAQALADSEALLASWVEIGIVEE